MADNRRNNETNSDGEEGGEGGGWGALAGVGLAIAAGVGLFFASRQREQPQETAANLRASNISRRRTEVQNNPVRNLIQSSGTPSEEPAARTESIRFNSSRRGVDRGNIPENPTISNLNSLLDDIFVRYIALYDKDFEMYYRIFTDVFRQIHMKMKEVNPYFKRYSSTVILGGSHYDRVRITKPDEFDVDIVIGLPLNMKEHRDNPKDSDIVLEPKDPGFVQLKMGPQFKSLPNRGDSIDIQAYLWRDDKYFLLRSEFMDWFKGVVDRALNLFNRGSTPIIHSGGVPYTVRMSESGPAKTLYIENQSQGFKLDVDLVPALKFPEERWPITNSYRGIQSQWSNPENIWLLVPKPNKNAYNDQEISRSWRIGLHIQEGKIIHDTGNLRQVLRLLKKLRDAQGMKKIASYYLKTLVLWEVVKRQIEPRFWNQNPATLFKILVREFYNALIVGKIPYFWNKNNNLIQNIGQGVLNGYAAKLEGLLEVLENASSYKHVAKYLLTTTEFREYNDKFLHI